MLMTALSSSNRDQLRLCAMSHDSRSQIQQSTALPIVAVPRHQVMRQYLDDAANDELSTLATARGVQDVEAVLAVLAALELEEDIVLEGSEALGADEAGRTVEFSIAVHNLRLGFESLLAACTGRAVQVHNPWHVRVPLVCWAHTCHLSPQSGCSQDWAHLCPGSGQSCPVGPARHYLPCPSCLELESREGWHHHSRHRLHTWTLGCQYVGWGAKCIIQNWILSECCTHECGDFSGLWEKLCKQDVTQRYRPLWESNLNILLSPPHTQNTDIWPDTSRSVSFRYQPAQIWTFVGRSPLCSLCRNKSAHTSYFTAHSQDVHLFLAAFSTLLIGVFVLSIWHNYLNSAFRNNFSSIMSRNALDLLSPNALFAHFADNAEY